MSAESLPALPPLHELQAPPDWRAIEFVSDLHLAADTPRTLDAFAAYLRDTDADAVLILGDLFEVWVGDDARFDGFEASCAALLAEAASRRVIGFMAGNRDFLVGPALLADCGLLALPDPTVLVAFGQRWLLTHGDALCLADHDYQRFRAQVRSARWQADFLERPLADRFAVARQMRGASEQRKRSTQRADWADVDPAAALRWMDEAASPVMIHGHTHQPGTGAFAPGRVRHVLSDWDLDHDPQHPRAEVLRLSAEGLTRRPAGAAADPDHRR